MWIHYTGFEAHCKYTPKPVQNTLVTPLLRLPTTNFPSYFRRQNLVYCFRRQNLVYCYRISLLWLPFLVADDTHDDSDNDDAD